MVRAEDYLKFAEFCLQNPALGEIGNRMAAARAYYSVFHLIQDYLCREHGFDPDLPGSQSHIRVRKEMEAVLYGMGRHTAPEFLRSANKIWKTLSDVRFEADYRKKQSFDSSQALSAVSLARNIFTAYQRR